MNIVISINVFEKPDFLITHIENIKQHLLTTNIIILSCNDFMFQALKNKDLPPNVILNPEIINKRRFHGSLTKGIVSNMRLALERYAFRYFIVLGSGTFFYNPIDLHDLDSLQQKWTDINEYEKETKSESNTIYNNWWWPEFLKLALAKYYCAKNRKLKKKWHEGLTVSNNVCKNIITFLNNHPHMEKELFSFQGCVEEFAIQTIAFNEVNWQNSEYGFISLGRSCYIDEKKPCDKLKWVYKKERI